MKHFFKKNKKVKGMTLIEVIVAMFVFTIAALVMVKMGQVSQNFIRRSLTVNRKTSIQAPVSEAGYSGGALAAKEDDMSITVTVGSKSTTVSAESYSTQAAFVTEEANIEYAVFPVITD